MAVKTSRTIQSARPDRPQYVLVRCEEASAGGGKVVQIPTSLTTRDRVGIEILQYECVTGVNLGLAATGDSFIFGLTQMYNAGVPPDPSTVLDYTGVIDLQNYGRTDFGTPATTEVRSGVYNIQFKEPPLVHPAAVFAFVLGYNQPTALNFVFRIMFRYVDLNEQDYQDILQTIIIQNAI